MNTKKYSDLEDWEKDHLDSLFESWEKLNEEVEPDTEGVRKVINTNNYEFDIPSKSGDESLHYVVGFTESLDLTTNKKIVEIKFKLMNNPHKPQRSQFQTRQQYNVALQQSQIGLTNTGNQRRVFGKVFGSIVLSIKEIQPDYITFVAEERRKFIYSRFIKSLEKYILPLKYKNIDSNPLTNGELNIGEFWLEKIQI